MDVCSDMIGKIFPLLLLSALVADSYSTRPNILQLAPLKLTKFRRKTILKQSTLLLLVPPAFTFTQQKYYTNIYSHKQQLAAQRTINNHFSNDKNFNRRVRQYRNTNEHDKITRCWANPSQSNNPTSAQPELEVLWRSMSSISMLGGIETGYITYSSIVKQQASMYCPALFTTSSNIVGDGLTGGCLSVLSGPYSIWPGTDIPLSAFGFVAYTFVSFLSFRLQIASNDGRDFDENLTRITRIVLGSVSTGMGVFSILLVSFSMGVLKEACFYCIVSAVLSVALMCLSWFGGVLPQVKEEEQIQEITESVTRTTTMSMGSSAIVAIFAGLFVLTGGFDNYNILQPPSATASVQQAAVDSQPESSLFPRLLSPPPVTTISSQRAIELCKNMAKYNTKFYGAYWCSHCYEQKQRLGYEAMTYIPYIECDTDGLDNQRALCKIKKIPGYPTWEINNQLYPGEQSIEELEEIVASIVSEK
jgi:uncharacterized membrane protein